MKTKELNGYKIEFYSEEEWKYNATEYSTSIELRSMSRYLGGDNKNTLYAGLVSDISEELAEKIVDKCNTILRKYINYWDENNVLKLRDAAKQSFQTLSDLPYCVITN